MENGEAFSTRFFQATSLRHLTRPHRRLIDVAGVRVENGEAFSTRFFQATSLRHLTRPHRQRINVAGA